MRMQLGTWRPNKAVSMIDQIEHRWNDECARDHPDHECDLLLPRSRINELPGLEILQVVVSDRGDVENDRSGEKRECHQSFARIRRNVWLHAKNEQQGGTDYHQDANAR